MTLDQLLAAQDALDRLLTVGLDRMQLPQPVFDVLVAEKLLPEQPEACDYLDALVQLQIGLKATVPLKRFSVPLPIETSAVLAAPLRKALQSLLAEDDPELLKSVVQYYVTAQFPIPALLIPSALEVAATDAEVRNALPPLFMDATRAVIQQRPLWQKLFETVEYSVADWSLFSVKEQTSALAFWKTTQPEVFQKRLPEAWDLLKTSQKVALLTDLRHADYSTAFIQFIDEQAEDPYPKIEEAAVRILVQDGHSDRAHYWLALAHEVFDDPLNPDVDVLAKAADFPDAITNNLKGILKGKKALQLASLVALVNLEAVFSIPLETVFSFWAKSKWSEALLFGLLISDHQHRPIEEAPVGYKFFENGLRKHAYHSAVFFRFYDRQPRPWKFSVLQTFFASYLSYDEAATSLVPEFLLRTKEPWTYKFSQVFLNTVRELAKGYRMDQRQISLFEPLLKAAGRYSNLRIAAEWSKNWDRHAVYWEYWEPNVLKTAKILGQRADLDQLLRADKEGI